ncbi:alanine racemase [Citroniella saccharovorans]|uniref:Alanine racemase n=1 Tax=Citroniella saccharovorans TaxID=2053367 RepID=A0AAW9MS83_9FIRM|nr:alanine racemase [Citroniella saccharovorans]MEB3430024.1 alanine racemase [Citroniella saccharovorans]
MENIISPTWAEINLDNLRHNIESFKEKSSIKKISAVIKANAYGHGAVDVAREIEDIVDYFSVSSISEGIELRKSGIKKNIMILTQVEDEYLDYAIKYNIEPSIFTLNSCKKLNEKLQASGKKLGVHIKLDTGMRRVGFLPNEKSIEDIVEISKLENIILEGVFTHFASADENDKVFTEKQFSTFYNMLEKINSKGIKFNIRHVDNDAAFLMYDFSMDMVRLGIGLYGIYPSSYVKENTKTDLRPVMSLKSKISYIKDVKKGDTIGYGRTYTAPHDIKVATIMAGYADGLPRSLSNNGYILVGEEKAKILGRICMDQVMVELKNLNHEIGETVTIFGDKEITVNDIADMDNTISYEILSRIPRRVSRVYKKGGKTTKVVNYLLNNS